MFSETDYNAKLESAEQQLMRIEGLTEDQMEVLLQHRYQLAGI